MTASTCTARSPTWSNGIEHVFIEHYWDDESDLEHLRRTLGAAAEEWSAVRFTLDPEQHLARIARRASARALDESDFERRTVAEERAALDALGDRVGQAFAVGAPIDQLVERLRGRLGLR